MNANDFCNWLQGYFELANPMSIGPSEIAMIREHLELASKKEPQRSTDYKYTKPLGRNPITVC